jgi:hypothetical protein|tara:strand:+ start:345 stop:569 length:225 start_codon:yes stop_codon:yes gene_type:complete
MMDMNSSIKKKGRYVTQIIHFVGGEKRTIDNIDTTSVVQGQFTKFVQKNGTMVMVNDKNVLFIEVFNGTEEIMD